MKYLPYIFFLSLSLFSKYSNAQSIIKLKDIEKIDFIIKRGGFYTTEYKKVEVVHYGNTWKSYQTRYYNALNFKTRQQINDSSKIFLKNIKRSTLKKIIKILAEKDSDIHVEEFDIDKQLLVDCMDSLNFMNRKDYTFTTEQRANFISLLQTNNLLTKQFTGCFYTENGMMNRNTIYL